MAKSGFQATNPAKKSTTGTSAASGGSTSGQGTGAGRTLNSNGYDKTFNYSDALQDKSLTSSERAQLEKERAAKIRYEYNNKEPNMTGSNKTYSQTYGTSSGGSGTSYTRPSSGGSSYSGGSSSGGSTAAKVPTTDTEGGFHKEAINAASRGEWDAVSRALADRQAKIESDGYGDRGVSNQQIYEQLLRQYGDSFNVLSQGSQDKVKLNAGLKLPYETSTGAAGQVYRDKGWEENRDYLDEARRLASAGDLEGAYEALMRRGFKLADGGSPSNGGGTSQDQAYAMIHQLYNQSPTARAQYENEVAINRRRLAEHPTQFGTGTNPSLANKRFVSQDGKYLILYDQSGTPSVALPSKGTYTSYSPEEIDLMSRYYNGDENTDFAELNRQIHNNSVVRTGVGRLVDREGNYASGTPAQPVSARDWTRLPQTDRYQDTAALRAILDQINAGESYAGGSVQVPADELSMRRAALSAEGSGGGGTSSGGSYGGGNYGDGSGWYGDYDYAGNDLTDYIRRIYQQNLEAQLAALRSSYEQNVAGLNLQSDRLSEEYRNRRNQTAAQNELQRLYMAELGAVQGLNTGTTGQLALAQGMALQNDLASLGAAESQDLANNSLALAQLGSAYRGSVDAAAAQSGADMASALYGELVRQIEAEEAARQAAQAQANWERQFAYQREMDDWDRQKWQSQWDYSLQADQRDSAYNLASTMLKNGILPDSATLAAAGISREAAASLVQAYQQAAMQSTKKSTKKSGSSGGGSGGVQDYSGLFNAAYGEDYPEVFIANNYPRYGFNKSTGLAEAYKKWSGDSGKLNIYLSNVNQIASGGNQVALDGYLKSIWGKLSGREREQIQSLLKKHGFDGGYVPD